MTAVIADDLTGAAEIAGIGWRHGLRAEILERGEPPAFAQLRRGKSSNAELLVYNSDSRNCSTAEARRRVAQITKRLQREHPRWIYKKVDSVLRGNVAAEIGAMLAALRLKLCILAPANPSAGRVIRDGHYFIHGKLLHQTDFRRDPHHPRFTSRVAELIGDAGSISVGEATSLADVRNLARKADGQILPAGGADFFCALLAEKKFHQKKLSREKPAPGKRILFVCGSVSESAVKFLKRSRAKRRPVLLMPDELLLDSRARAAVAKEIWAQSILAALKKNPRVVVAAGKQGVSGRQLSIRIGRALTDTVALALRGRRVDCVCVEGGATAAALIQKMGWTRFVVGGELSGGVVALRPVARNDLLLIVKPGSYKWPRTLAG